LVLETWLNLLERGKREREGEREGSDADRTAQKETAKRRWAE
jgi:hypothetical protein